jgi:hypothetical protein
MPGVAPQVGDLLAVTHVWTCQQQVAENTLHYLVSGVANGGSTIADVAKSFAAAASVVANDILPNIATYHGAMCRNLVTPQTRTAKWQGTAAGVVGPSVVPKQVSAIFSIYSALGGPKNRGRIFMPFLPIAFANSAGALSNQGITAYGLAIPNLCPKSLVVDGQGGTLSLTLVIRHGRGPVANPVPPGTFTVASEVVIQPILGTQRKRGDYGRINSPGF